MEVTQLLANASDVVKLEILPANQSGLSVRPQDTGQSWGGSVHCQDNLDGLEPASMSTGTGSGIEMHRCLHTWVDSMALMSNAKSAAL